jgi:hypothetical protein
MSSKTQAGEDRNSPRRWKGDRRAAPAVMTCRLPGSCDMGTVLFANSTTHPVRIEQGVAQCSNTMNRAPDRRVFHERFLIHRR